MSCKRPRILICIDWFDPAFKAGGPIRSCLALVDALVAHADVFVYTSAYDLSDNEVMFDVEADTWIHHPSGAMVYYKSSKSFLPHHLKSVVSDIRPDSIYLNSMFSVQYTLLPLWVSRNLRETRVILAPRGMLHQGAMRLGRSKKLLYLYVLKKTGLLDNIQFHATDVQERLDVLYRLGMSDSALHTIANLPISLSARTHFPDCSDAALKLVFVSRVSPKKNLKYLLKILAELEIVTYLDIYGPVDESYWWECSRLIEGLPPNISVHYHGAIPNNTISDVLQKAHFFILPTLGENYGHAIVEALACGVPVIISNNTPWSSLSKFNAGWAISLDDVSAWKTVLRDAANIGDKDYRKKVVGCAAYYLSEIKDDTLVDQYRAMLL